MELTVILRFIFYNHNIGLPYLQYPYRIPYQSYGIPWADRVDPRDASPDHERHAVGPPRGAHGKRVGRIRAHDA